MIWLSLLIGFSHLAKADLALVQGSYEVSPRIEVVTGWTEVQIQTQTKQGQREYEHYRKKGWECRRISNWTVCKGREFKPLAVEEGVRALSEVVAWGPLTVGALRAPAELLDESELFRQYRLYQEVRWGEYRWSMVDLYEFDDHNSLNLRDAQGQIERSLGVEEDGALTLMRPLRRRIDARKSQVVWLEITLRPISRH